MRARSLAMFMLLLASCGPKTSSGPSHSQEGEHKAGQTETTTKVVKDGNKTTVITTTKTWVEAPPAPARPADPWPADPLVKYNVDQINEYRKKKGAVALLYDAKISAFALQGSTQLASDHTPHAHFAAKLKGPNGMAGMPGFGSRAAENQGDWNGVPQMDPNPVVNGKKQIDVMLKLMFDEGPGGGHYENMINPKFRRVGIGIHYAGGKMYLTNDFSD